MAELMFEKKKLSSKSANHCTELYSRNLFKNSYDEKKIHDEDILEKFQTLAMHKSK